MIKFLLISVLVRPMYEQGLAIILRGADLFLPRSTACLWRSTMAETSRGAVGEIHEESSGSRATIVTLCHPLTAGFGFALARQLYGRAPSSAGIISVVRRVSTRSNYLTLGKSQGKVLEARTYETHPAFPPVTESQSHSRAWQSLSPS